MQKKFYNLSLVVLIILISQVNSFGQHLELPGRMGLHIKIPAKKNNASASNNTSSPFTNRTTSCSSDSIVLTRQSQIDSFPLTNPGCTVLRKLKIDGTGASPGITRLDSLKHLTQITEHLFVSHTSVTNLSGLSSLTSVGVFFWIDHNGSMTSMGLSNMTQIGLIILDSLPNLTSLSGLTYLLINKDLGTLIVSGTGLTTLTGLDSLHSFPNMYISNNKHLKSLQGLHHLISCDGGISIYGNDSLTNLTALSQINNINNGTLDCSYNGQLPNLTGLGNITNIGRGLWLEGNNALTSLANLNLNLVIQNTDVNNPGVYDSVRIFYNPQLALCSFPPLCNYLAGSSAAVIHDNAPGCNSIAEVKASCGICSVVTLKTWNGSANDEWNTASNWSPAGVPGSCDSVVINSGVTPRPKLTSNATIHALTMQSGTELYMNGRSLVVNGDVNIYAVIMGGGVSLTVNKATNISIQNSNLFISNIALNGYKALDLRSNSFSQYNSFTGNVTLVDSSTRISPQNIKYNTINGNLSITANAINNAAVTNFWGNSVTTGNASLTVNAPVGFNFGTNMFRVGGNLIISSNYPGYPDINKIEFTGNGYVGDSHITQLGSAAIEIANFTAYKTNGNIILDQDVYITSNARFFFGAVKTAANKLLVFKNGAGISTSSSGSYVWGPMKKIGVFSGQFIFPVGDSVYKGACRLSSPALPTDEFTVQYYHRNPNTNGYDTSQHVSSLNRVSGKEYWMINRTNGNSNVQVTLSYDSTRSGSLQSIYTLRVARWSGTQWQNEGNGNLTGNNSLAFVSSAAPVSNFGVFTLGFAPFYTPVITIGAIDSVICHQPPNFGRTPSVGVPDLIVHFTVDTLMFPNNIFRAELSDSTGSFANPVFIGSVTSNHSDSILATIPSTIPSGYGYRIRIVGTSPPDTSAPSNLFKIKTRPIVPFTIVGPNPGCINSGVNKYYASQKEPGVIYTWTLNGGGTMTTNQDTAFVTWTTVGNFTLTLSTSNFCGNGPSANKLINVANPLPTATPIITNTGRWLYASQAPANQNATGYNWYRNDTLISGATNASYYASAAGNFTVKYSNLCGVGPVSNIISFAAASIPQTINFPPILNKIYTDSPFVINATATSGLPVSFTIVSGPGNIPGNIYHITGTGTVTIRATQPGDNVYDTAASVEQTFTINKAPQTINFTAISDTVYGANPINLSATSTSGLPISYSVVSGPATLNGNTITLTGVGTVTVRATQPGDTNYLAATPVDRSFCVRISVLSPISGPATICPNRAVTYSVNNVPGATYTWRIAGGSTLSSTTNSITVTWPSPGTYVLIVSAAGNCGAPSRNDSLTVTAITSVQPDSVHNMLPVNGAINQQLPLTLSWIPANPNLYYTYDIYLWKASDPQPSTPYVANLTTVNYTIPLNSGLAYNTTYKWMVVAHNGSCANINTGPIQQFTLIPLPDLAVYNVTAPASAFSGQSVSVTWKVKNNGPGNTQLNQHWTDAVFISKDSVLDLTVSGGGLAFPIIPMLVATKPNVTALNAGDFYSDTATFTLPIDYSGPLYMHVITNYAPPANNPVIEVTKVNDTAHSSPATVITLSPQPDLRVDTVVNPNNTFSGSTINVQVKIKNYGVNASGSWIDNVYISKDAIFNISNAILLKKPNSTGSYYYANDAKFTHNGGLQQDSSYTVSLPVVVPNFIYGSYYVYVFTNATASLYEGPNQNNNVNRGNLMQVFLTATPKLIPVNVSIPSNISNTQTVPLQWNDQNQGAYDNIEKNKGHYAVPSGTCTIGCGPLPPGTTCYPATLTAYRDSIGFGSSYWIDKIYLSTDSTGLNPTNATLLSDYQVGTQYSGYSTPDGVQSIPCGAQSVPNANIATAILPSSSQPGLYNYTVSENLPQGNYYLYVYSNAAKTVYEYPGTSQITRSNRFTVSWPDLTVPSVTVPSTGNSGQPITINYSLLNIGPGGIYNHYRKDYIYLGNNSTFDGTAQLIDSIIYSSASVAVNVQQALQKQATLPNGVSGTKYIFVRANGGNSFSETNFNNNTNSVGAPINISLSPSPDFVVSSINVAGSVYSSIGFPFKYTVNNTGAGTASGTWKDSIFISCSSTYNPSTSYFVAVRTQQNYVPAGSSYTDSFNLVLPLTYTINNSGCLNNDIAQLYFFVKTNADKGFYEAVTNNNISGSTQSNVINALVDHIVTKVSSNDSALVGRYFKVNWTVKNIGLAPEYNAYNNWLDGIFISPDSVFNSNARYINGKAMSQRLNHDETYTDSLNCLIPNLPTGNYYLFAYTNVNNQILGERNTGNNINLRRNALNQPIKIYITNPPAPDLVNSILSAPTSTAVGQPIKIVYRITNNGVGPTYPSGWTDDVWLSNSFQPGGVFLSRKFHNGTLLPGQSYIDSISVTIPITQPQGNYTIVLNTDQDYNIYESNHTNNASYQYISVYIPAAVDLVVKEINVPDTLALGYPVTVNWKLSNISVNPARGTETDGIYLTRDTTTINNDILIGIKTNQLNLLPLNDTSLTSQSVISGVTEGNYFVKIKTDILNNIIESNKQNNTGIRTSKVYVTVKILPINVITPDILTSNYLYYKLIIPASLKGKTISVKLLTPDSLVANNQMYVGLGYLPSASRFDYAFSRPNFGNQQVIIESVTDSVYYIAAKGTSSNGANQNITLQATVLPFSILSVNANHGGNTGNVTILIKGTLFRDSMIAKIRGVSQNNTITASAIYFVNSATVYATFNLQGAPLGVYDVSLTKPDGTVATLPSGFTVEQTNNGGLLTGGGSNTGQTGTGSGPGCDPGAPSGLNSQLQTEVIIPPKVFASWPFTIQINYTNASNVDIPAQVRILYSLDGAPVSLTEAGLSEGKTSLYIEFKDALFHGNIIRAGGSGTIKVYSKAPINGFAHEFIHFTLQ